MERNLDIGVLLPGVGVFGGVRRFIQIGNEFVRRGHRYVIYHPTGEPPKWLAYQGEVAPLDEIGSHDVLICNDPPLLAQFEGARAKAKFFYFALEGIRGEGDIVRNASWTVLANSTGLSERLRRRYGVQVEKVIGGIDTQVFAPSDEETRNSNEFRVMVFGRFSRGKKGARIAVGAVERLARHARGVKLVLFDHVGPGNEEDPREGFRTSVEHEFHLNLKQEELARLYNSCNLFVSAEKKAGWSNTVAEAMASGVPVVCTRSGTVDIARHLETAWVVRWRHRLFVERGAKTLFEDRALANRLSAKAREHIANFSWTHVADQLETLMRRKLEGTR